MQRRQRPQSLTLLALLWAGCLSGLVGCSSTTQLDSIETQLSEIQRQLLQIQRLAASTERLEDLESLLSAEADREVRTEADVRVALDGISKRVEELQARMEEATYSLSQLSQRVAETQRGLEAVLVATSRASPPVEPTATTRPADPQELYRSAYDDYLRGNYDLAILSFRQYVASYPTTDQADNALYWIGECYFSQGKFREAISEFSRVQAEYPSSDRLASSLLKKAFAYLELDDRENGIRQLRSVIATYPRSDEAKLAQQQLAVEEGRDG